MSDDMVTYKDLAKLLGVTETTIKSYRRKFPPFLMPENQGKPLRFPGICASVCTRIRDSFARGLSVEETRAVLVSEFPHLLAGSGPQSGPQSGLLADPLSGPITGSGAETGHGFAPGASSSFRGTSGAEASASDRPQDTLDVQSGAHSAHPGLVPVLDQLAQGLERVAQAQETLAQQVAEGLTDLRADLQNRLGSTLSPLPDFFSRAEQRDDSLTRLMDSLQQTVSQLARGLGRGPFRPADQIDSPTGSTSDDAPAAPVAPVAPVAPAAPAAPVRKRVNVTNAQGEISSYVLETRESEDVVSASDDFAIAPEPKTRPGAAAESGTGMRTLPLVVRSERGEYLGVGGRALGTVSLYDLADMARRAFTGEEAYGAQWDEGAHKAVLRLARPGGGYELTAQRTTTPRGNEVAELTGLEVDGKPVATGYAVTFVRRLRERLDPDAMADGPGFSTDHAPDSAPDQPPGQIPVGRS